MKQKSLGRFIVQQFFFCIKIIRKIWNFDMIEAESVHYKKFFFYKNRNSLKAQVYKWTNCSIV